MLEKKHSLLIIEDDLDVAEMLNAYFRVQGYEVLTADWGEDGVQTALTSMPDLIILDIRLPDIDGFEVAEKLRSHRRTQNIPIIFLTERRQRIDRLKGLSLGADDYITKPFDIQELRLRVRNALRRASQGGLNNPITGLPEGPVVEERLSQLIDAPDGWSLVAARIENLEAFREAFGFVAADDVLRAISLLIERAVHDLGSSNTFTGHLSSTEILVILHHSAAESFQLQLSSRISQSIDLFYPVEVRESGSPIADQVLVRIGGLGPDGVRAAGDVPALIEKLVKHIG